MVANPPTEQPLRLAPQRTRPALATFTLKFHLLGLGPPHILNPERQQFGHAGSRVVEQHEEQVIPPTRPRVLGRCQERFNLRTREVADQGLDLPLEREGQNATRGRRQLRPQPIRQVVHEGAPRRQASVAGTDGVAPLLLQMIQKAQDGVGRPASHEAPRADRLKTAL